MGGMISGIGTMYSGIAGGIQEQQAAQYEWNTNRALADYGGRAARLQGQIEEGKVRQQGGELQAQQKVAYENSGVDSTVGTAAAVQADTGARTEENAQVVRNKAAREAWGFKVQNEQSHQQYKQRVGAAQNKMVGSVLTGAGQFMGGLAGL